MLGNWPIPAHFQINFLISDQHLSYLTVLLQNQPHFPHSPNSDSLANENIHLRCRKKAAGSRQDRQHYLEVFWGLFLDGKADRREVFLGDKTLQQTRGFASYSLPWGSQKGASLTSSGGSELGCLFLKEENLCWLRTENLRKDSLLRDAKCLKEEVLLKGVLVPPSPPLRSWATAVVTKFSASCKDLRTVPIHWVMWVCATVSLSPR